MKKVNTEIKKTVYESTLSIVLCSVIELIAGIFLLHIENEIKLLPGLLILLPGILDMRGNIFCALGSRLSSALHLGYIEPSFKLTPTLKTNIFATLLLNIIMPSSLAIFAYLTTILLGFEHISLIAFLLISLISSFLSGIILIFIIIFIAILSYRFGLDPDNITTPLAATLGDITVVFFLLVTVKFILWVGII